MDKKTKKHIETLNREMGEVRTELKFIHKQISSFSKRMDGFDNKLTKMDNRVWWILGTVGLSILVQIFLKMIGGG